MKLFREAKVKMKLFREAKVKMKLFREGKAKMKPLVCCSSGYNSFLPNIEYTINRYRNLHLPVCFYDINTDQINLEYIINEISYNILSLEEVLTRYPDAEFYIVSDSPEKRFEIIQSLFDSAVSQNRIIKLSALYSATLKTYRTLRFILWPLTNILENTALDAK